MCKDKAGNLTGTEDKCLDGLREHFEKALNQGVLEVNENLETEEITRNQPRKNLWRCCSILKMTRVLGKIQ